MKRRAVVDADLLDAYRGWQPCWWCGRTLPCSPHHLVGRGQEGHRRADVPLNLAASCMECHSATHAGERPLLCDWIAVVASRNGVSIEEVEDCHRSIRWGKP